MKNISQAAFLDLEVSLPPLPEQQKIASFFTAIDRKLGQLRKKKALMEQYKKGVMQGIFSRRLRFKGEGGQEFGEWEEKPFGEVVSSRNGKFDPTKEKATNKPIIELEHIESNTGRLLGQTDSSLTKSIKNSFQKGDVLFGKLRPYLRKYAVAPFDGVCSSEIWVLKGTQLDNGFLYFLIQTDTFIEAANKSSGSKMPRADWSIVASLKFLIPSKKEQMKIASFLFAIETKVARTQAQLEKIEEWKKGLLQKMFV